MRRPEGACCVSHSWSKCTPEALGSRASGDLIVRTTGQNLTTWQKSQEPSLLSGPTPGAGRRVAVLIAFPSQMIVMLFAPRQNARPLRALGTGSVTVIVCLLPFSNGINHMSSSALVTFRMLIKFSIFRRSPARPALLKSRGSQTSCEGCNGRIMSASSRRQNPQSPQKCSSPHVLVISILTSVAVRIFGSSRRRALAHFVDTSALQLFAGVGLLAMLTDESLSSSRSRLRLVFSSTELSQLDASATGTPTGSLARFSLDASCAETNAADSFWFASSEGPIFPGCRCGARAVEDSASVPQAAARGLRASSIAGRRQAPHPGRPNRDLTQWRRLPLSLRNVSSPCTSRRSLLAPSSPQLSQSVLRLGACRCPARRCRCLARRCRCPVRRLSRLRARWMS
eukprot:scaffold520_cov224-Pinguiococcus_pyrenoidosus.AAC.6